MVSLRFFSMFETYLSSYLGAANKLIPGLNSVPLNLER
jgi:hypothetical protein